MTPSRALVCGLCANLFSALTSAATAAATNSTWSVHVWQSDDGLPNNNVTSLAQTADGYLWAANPSVLVRFDGVQFEQFAPRSFGGSPNQKVLVVLRSQAGGLWLGLEHGVVVRLNSGATQIFTRGLPDLKTQTLTE